MLRSLCVTAAVTVGCCGAPLDSFLAPVAGIFAADADMTSPSTVPDASACATICLAAPGCISFNLCGSECGIQTWNLSYVPGSSATCSYYRRSIPRNDSAISQRVPWLLTVPPGGVQLQSGALLTGFEANLNYLRSRDPLDMIFFFAERAGVSNPPGKCYGWGGWIKGSEAGN